MAKNWYIDTSAGRDAVIEVARDVFFAKPSIADRLKFWSKAAQLQSNIRWEPTSVSGADLAAEVVSGGIREAVGSSRRGGGSMLGTTLALQVEARDGGSAAQLGLTSYNTFFGVNQQGDLAKSYAKQIAGGLRAKGFEATPSRR